MSFSKMFIPDFVCVFSQIKDRKHIEQNVSFCCRCHAAGVGLGVLRGSKTLAWGIAMAPYQLRVIVYCLGYSQYLWGGLFVCHECVMQKLASVPVLQFILMRKRAMVTNCVFGVL